MNKALITRNGAGVEITAPEGKSMVFDPSLLQHGILSLGEYGPSGVKIVAFKNWDDALFLDGSEGYKIKNISGER